MITKQQERWDHSSVPIVICLVLHILVRQGVILEQVDGFSIRPLPHVRTAPPTSPTLLFSSALWQPHARHTSSHSTKLKATRHPPPPPPPPVPDQQPAAAPHVRLLNRLGFRRTSHDNHELHQQHQQQLDNQHEQQYSSVVDDMDEEDNDSQIITVGTKRKYNITTLDELDAYFRDDQRRFRKTAKSSSANNNNNNKRKHQLENDFQHENQDEEKDDIDYKTLLRSLYVAGDTQIIGSPDHPDYTHPVVRLLHERKHKMNDPNNNSNSNHQMIVNNTNGKVREDDGARVALCIEGGGMRGCVSAGMVVAIHYLNLTNTIDVVYGSSAGTIVGSYFITEQLPWFGPEVYYDALTTAGRRFIDTRRLLRALGFGLLDPRLLKDVLMRPHHGKPVLNLPFLLQTTLQEKKPLDWKTFQEKQNVQPLKVIASGCKSEKAVVMDMENGSFESLSELADCMHASCLLPGIAGPLMNMDKRVVNGYLKNGKKMVLGNNLQGDDAYEPLADALLFEPLPYRSAIAEGATHVVVIRSRPDGVDVTGKSSLFERLIFRRFFLRKNRLPNMYQRLKRQLHKKLYAEDIIVLNQEAYSERDYKDTSRPHLMALAAPPGSQEVTRLETGRQAIFEGLRRGFARAYDCLVEDPSERGRGTEVAKLAFPDEILDYDPLAIESTTMSAFEAYMKEQGIYPKSWSNGASRGSKASSPTAAEQSVVR